MIFDKQLKKQWYMIYTGIKIWDIREKNSRNRIVYALRKTILDKEVAKQTETTVVKTICPRVNALITPK